MHDFFSLNVGVFVFQILTLYDAVDSLNIDSLVSWVAGLQQEDGSFYGDKWGGLDLCARELWSMLDVL